MPKYTVIITRDITESTVIEVEADSPDAAEDAAHEALSQSSDAQWEIDDGSWNKGNHYVTDVSETGQ
jgi:hypothetical protein